MKYMFKITSFLILFGLYNCTATKEAAKDTINAKTNTPTITAKQMIDKGFSKGTIKVNKSSDCPYILNIEEYDDNLDPINIKEFFKDNIPEKVWVKFGSLRMPSRCTNARPITIIEIDKRIE